MGRVTILYSPPDPVTASRTFSMSAGLDTSTFTPGMTAPDLSLTTPAIDPVVNAWPNNGLAPAANNNTHSPPIGRILATLMIFDLLDLVLQIPGNDEPNT